MSQPDESPAASAPEEPALPIGASAPSGSAPGENATQDRALPPLRQQLGDLVAGFEIDLRPLDQQEWVWAGPETVRFKTLRAPASNTPSPEQRGPLNPTDRYGTFLRDLDRALALWDERPMVWRVHNGEMQAVYRGLVRFSWSCAQPQGRAERWNTLNGWTVCTVDEVISIAHNGVNLTDLARPVGRHAQRHAPRRTAWHLPDHPDLTWVPLPMQRTETMDEGMARRKRLARDERASLRAIGRTLARLDPLWGVIVKALWRVAVPQDTILQPVYPMLRRVLPRLLNHWAAWSHAVTEHPRAHVLLMEALENRIPPGPHTWHPDVWTAMHPTARPVVWRQARSAPLTLVASVSRGTTTFYERLAVLDACGCGPLPSAALRAVPSLLWEQAHHPLVEHAAMKDAQQQWPLRRLRAYLDAVKRRPWVQQRLGMTVWLLRAQPVLDWLTTLDTAPDSLTDPSWGWDALVRAWLRASQDLPSWGRPFQPWICRGVGLAVVTNDAEWALLGSAMANCLKDQRSAPMRNLARNHKGLLVRLSGAEQSVAFIGWTPGADTGSGGWTVQQHYRGHNHPPSQQHEALAIGLAQMLDATVTPTGFVPAGDRTARLALLREDGLDPQGLLDALDDRWGDPAAEESSVLPVPGWGDPVARVARWINDDEWWTVSGFFTWLEGWSNGPAGILTLLGALLGILLIVSGLTLSWNFATAMLGMLGLSTTVALLIQRRLTKTT